MVSLKDSLTPTEAQELIAAHLRERRLRLNISQDELARRSGVPLATLRKFEQKGLVSLGSFLKLKAVLGGLGGMVEAIEPDPVEYRSIEDVIRANRPRQARKRARSRRTT